MQADALKQLQDVLLMQRLAQRGNGLPQANSVPPQERFDPEVLLQLLQPNLIKPDQKVRRMLQNDGIPNPSEQDVQDMLDEIDDPDRWGPDDEIQQTPSTLMINKSIKKEPVI